jgi:hypothetical protein
LKWMNDGNNYCPVSGQGELLAWESCTRSCSVPPHGRIIEDNCFGVLRISRVS